MNWSDFQLSYRKSSFELAAFQLPDEDEERDRFRDLGYWALATSPPSKNARLVDNWLSYSAEVHSKILCRGIQTFPQIEIEDSIRRCFFLEGDFIEPDVPSEIGWVADKSLQERRASFVEFGMAVPMPAPEFNSLDPENPQNERRLLEMLFDIAGTTVGAFVHSQVPLDELFASDAFSSQRADIVLALPNGKGLVLEPGDHGGNQRLRDEQRDRRFTEDPIRSTWDGLERFRH